MRRAVPDPTLRRDTPNTANFVFNCIRKLPPVVMVDRETVTGRH
jgi:hypothetical protein